VIDQAPEIQARRSLDTVLRGLGLIDIEISAQPVQFLTITPENVPEGRCCAYANFFEKCRLFFLIPACILEMLYCLGLASPRCAQILFATC